MPIRHATEADLPVILDIYNDAVINSTAIWNEIVIDLDNRKAWLAARQARSFPVLVAEEEGRVAGYASYGDWRSFDGYKHTVEHSVYVHKDHQGRGHGRKLMEALLDHAGEAGLHAMIAAIEGENAASIALHEKLGFVHIGRYPEVGTKFGRWLDLVTMQYTFGG
ncbi:GNAT family N-acetyltransferase [Martelella endophytica]|uniref:Acetyltransferase n=1 Tax=Martelella endophytica TaxID=1486262 RepID=A0A0D5LNX7_MAREN|nr:GNAT family N-acetyltransferase [Martelella endophytica]AJY45655.1 acetyltransferase [Martelella endophytica]